MNVVEICNMALMRLGHDRQIADLTEMSAEAGYCNTFWDHCRKATLRAYPWNFAVRTVVLAPLSETSTQYDFIYQIPTGCLRALEIVNTTGDTKIKFEVRGRKIYTNQQDAELKYILDVEDTNLFDFEYIDALAYLLAAEISGPLTGDRARRGDNYEIFRLRIKDAAATDASEGEPEQSTSYLDARG